MSVLQQQDQPAGGDWHEPSSVIVWSDWIVRGLVVVLLAVSVSNIAAQLGMLYLAQGRSDEIVRLFNVSSEANIPSWFNSMLLLGNALLLALLVRIDRCTQGADATYWKLLAGAFLYLSVDEAAALHENLNQPTRVLLAHLGVTTDGLLTFAWPVAAVMMLAAAAFPFVRFLRRLPRWLSRRMILAGAIFLSGAVVMELVGGYMLDTYGYYSKGFAIASSIEEFLETAGQIVFADALLRYIREQISTKELAVHVR